jgi:hypothetical protein
MRKTVVNHGRANTPPLAGRIGRFLCPECRGYRECLTGSLRAATGRPCLVAGTAGSAAAGTAGSAAAGSAGPVAACLAAARLRRRPHGCACAALNWALRGYGRAQRPRVMLFGRVQETGGTARARGLLQASSRRPSVAAATVAGPGQACLCAPGTRPAARPAISPGGGSPAAGRGPCHRLHRNGQMEHSAQVAAGLRGGVRRRAAIAVRENARHRDQVLTTFGSEMCVYSNIFRFVAT